MQFERKTKNKSNQIQIRIETKTRTNTRNHKKTEKKKKWNKPTINAALQRSGNEVDIAVKVVAWAAAAALSQASGTLVLESAQMLRKMLQLLCVYAAKLN